MVVPKTPDRAAPGVVVVFTYENNRVLREPAGSYDGEHTFMKLGKAAGYAIFPSLYIVQNEGKRPVTGREIAERCGIPSEYLLKILQRLVRSRILSSERGRSGGFRLRQSPAQTTLLAIIEAVEGPLDAQIEVSAEFRCPQESMDTVAKLFDEIARHTRERLAATTIEDLMRMNGSGPG